MRNEAKTNQTRPSLAKPLAAHVHHQPSGDVFFFAGPFPCALPFTPHPSPHTQPYRCGSSFYQGKALVSVAQLYLQRMQRPPASSMNEEDSGRV